MEKGFAGSLTRVCAFAAMLLAFLAAAFNAVAGMLYTAEIEVDPLVSNVHVILHADNIAANLGWLIAVMAALLLFARLRVSRRCARIAGAAALAVIAVCGVLWVRAVRSDPYADGMHIVDFCKYMISGGYFFEEYFRMYPFQLQFAPYIEALLRVFGVANIGALHIANVVLLTLAYAALLRITELLFDDARVELMTAALLIAFIEPIFFCSWIYGNIPGFFFAVAGTLCSVSFLKRGGGWKLFAAAALLSVGATVKSNYAIYCVANGIVLLLFALRRKSWKPVAAVALLFALTALLPAGVQKSYAARTGIDFGKGMPMLHWLVMGGNESYRGPGWFDGSNGRFEENGYDRERTGAELRAELKKQAALWRTEPMERVRFYIRKTVSQWNEPDFQSIWSSRVSTRSIELTPLAQSIVYGAWRGRLYAYFNQILQVIYVCFALALLRLTCHKEPSLPALLLPLAFFGTFLYHLLFEAQSLYVLMSVPAMLPYCAYALAKGDDDLCALFSRRRRIDRG